ncbi:NAD(P)/FAD-dependent oxidoreductase [Nocardia seriolae]|uniref:Pyridine nucleotide-disulfide oxidoreductase n=1 Tax=Nocardia seriolae TaxID=37332 RepID=A0ABC9Z183_9NOCA|nr:FAD-dependent oxidoreductase [Nocardia seriolae]OJF81133.1 hypothetical protein NS14008_20440 [Nocardia seriolae]QOW34891.1 FAD-dependent oxidoreductase [Nocardia seriolae]QUN17645.1 FAD-dependent oxidoreductase [Nocardia seriolae]WKY49635.1 FAD-dependent oxidoreductase [Nocardia seriolae]WNJ62136.1 FAD-dependent oxidoreductase [Nocardia seriolae]
MTGRIVIVGAGVAGATAARTLRTEGYTGDIVVLGTEPVHPYRRPMVSKEILAATVEERRTLLQPPDFWRTHDIDLRLGTTVESIDPGPALVWLADGTAIGYDSLLLATGARPRSLAVTAESTALRSGAVDVSAPRDSGVSAAGIRNRTGEPGRNHAGMTGRTDAAVSRGLAGDSLGVGESDTSRGTYGGVGGGGRVLTLRGREDAEILREAIARSGSLLIIGAGLIGCEVAATARGLGAQVTVLDAGAAPMERVVPGVVGDYVRKLHAEHGVAIDTEVRLTHLAAEGNDIVAVAEDDNTWNAGAVLVAIGSVPDTWLAQAAGLAVADGIRVDEGYRTSSAGIYAAGDVASRFDPETGEYRRAEHWNSAQAQGAAAARSMLGLPPVAAEVPWGWTVQYGRNMQFAGMIGAGDELAVRGRLESGDATVLGLRQGRVTGAVAIARPAEFRAARDLIGRGAELDPGACADESVPLAAAAELSGQS